MTSPETGPRRLSLLLAAAIAGLAFAGCGEKSEPALDTTSPASTTTTPTEPLGEELQSLESEDVSGAGSLEGTWRGKLEQKGVKPFPVTATIKSVTDKPTNTVSYGGSIGCSGTWRYAGGKGPTVRFDERIDKGQGGDCKGEGVVTLRFAKSSTDRLLYRFEGGGVTSSGTLTAEDRAY